MSLISLVLSIFIVVGSFALAWYLWQRLLTSAERLKELHEDLARKDHELQSRMIEIETTQTSENKKD